MDGVKQQIHARKVQVVEAKHLFETRKLKRELKAELNKLSDSNKTIMNSAKRTYESAQTKEKTSLESKLITLRDKNKLILKEENTKFSKLLEEIEITQQAKINEITKSNDNEIAKQQESHSRYLETAENKFEAAKSRLEA